MSGRRISIEGTHNFRDVGGYPATGGTTRSGQLYRSDALSQVTDKGARQLAALGIEVVVDLRSDMERRQDHSRNLLPDAIRVDLPIHGGSRTALINDGPVTLVSLYHQVLADSGWSIAAAVSVIADSGKQPVLVHCTAGKDRTGLVIALTLEAAGVDRAAVVADYTQSALNLDGAWIHTAMNALVSHGVPISARLFEALGGSPDHAMTDILQGLDAHYGSTLGYLKAHGFPAAAADELHEKLVG